MQTKIRIKFGRKTHNKQESLNQRSLKDDKIEYIRKEIDKLPGISKKRYQIKGKIDLLKSCIIMNLIFSIPIGTYLIFAGALNSIYIIFICGIFILLESICIYALSDIISFILKNVYLLRIRRYIAKYQ